MFLGFHVGGVDLQEAQHGWIPRVRRTAPMDTRWCVLWEDRGMFVLWASPNVGIFITYRADPDLIAPQLDPTTTIPLLLGYLDLESKILVRSRPNKSCGPANFRLTLNV